MAIVKAKPPSSKKSLKANKKNIWAVAIVVTLVATVGGLFVYRSFAAPKHVATYNMAYEYSRPLNVRSGAKLLRDRIDLKSPQDVVNLNPRRSQNKRMAHLGFDKFLSNGGYQACLNYRPSIYSNSNVAITVTPTINGGRDWLKGGRIDKWHNKNDGYQYRTICANFRVPKRKDLSNTYFRVDTRGDGANVRKVTVIKQ